MTKNKKLLAKWGKKLARVICILHSAEVVNQGIGKSYCVLREYKNRLMKIFNMSTVESQSE